MPVPLRKYRTPEEYLAAEETAEFKSEYYHGEIFALAGGTINHNRIVRNVCSRLNQALSNHKCEAFMNDLRLWVKAKDLYTYPDILVVCNKLEFYPERDDTIINPTVIIEVLSEATKNYDRGEKFLCYRFIPGFKEYILIDQYKIHIEHFCIGEKGKWELTEYNDINEILLFSQLDVQLPLRDIYFNVEFTTAP